MSNRWDYMRDPRYNPPRMGCPKCTSPSKIYEVGGSTRRVRMQGLPEDTKVTLYYFRCSEQHFWYTQEDRVPIDVGEWRTGKQSSFRKDESGAYLERQQNGNSWFLYQAPAVSGKEIGWCSSLEEGQALAAVLIPDQAPLDPSSAPPAPVPGLVTGTGVFGQYRRFLCWVPSLTDTWLPCGPQSPGSMYLDLNSVSSAYRSRIAASPRGSALIASSRPYRLGYAHRLLHERTSLVYALRGLDFITAPVTNVADAAEIIPSLPLLPPSFSSDILLVQQSRYTLVEPLLLVEGALREQLAEAPASPRPLDEFTAWGELQPVHRTIGLVIREDYRKPSDVELLALSQEMSALQGNL